MAVPVIGYNPIEDISAVFSKVDIVLNYQECGDEEMSIHPHSYPSSPLDWDISDLVVNVGEISLSKLPEFEEDPNLEPTPYYYILTPEYLESALKDLAAWKRQKGHTVIVKTFEDIYADKETDNYDGETAIDPESKVRNWLKRERDSVGRFKLLLIGDENSGAPIRKFFNWYGSDQNYWGENFYPCDGYFSDLSSEVKLEKQPNGFYSYSNPNLVFDIPVGRILADKKEELKFYIDKLLIYELDPGLGNTSYLDNGIAYFHNQMYKELSIFPYIQGISNIEYHYDSVKEDDSFSNNLPTGQDVIKSLRKCGLICLNGHGSPYTLRYAGGNSDHNNGRYIQSLSNYNKETTNHKNIDANNGFDNLENFDRPSIIYSTACDVMPFDNVVFDDINPNTHKNLGLYPGTYSLGKSFTSAGHFGGPAFIGNTRSGIIEYSDILGQRFGRFLNWGYNLGDALCISANRHSPHTGGLAYYNLYEKNIRNLVGDPDIKIWLGNPLSFEISVTCDSNVLSITGDNLSESSISFYDGINNLLSINCPEDITECRFSTSLFPNKSGSDFITTIYRDGHLPFTYLYGGESIISDGINKNYFMNVGNISIRDYYGKYKYCFKITNNGKLSLNIIRSLNTFHAFVIENGGTVEITANKNVNLCSDIIKDGGRLSIDAKSVKLDCGFTVEKGGILIINTKTSEL